MSPWASHCVFLLALFWNLWIATGHKSMWIRRLAYFKTLRTHSTLTEWSVYKLFKWLDSRLLLLKCTFVTISPSADHIASHSAHRATVRLFIIEARLRTRVECEWDLMPLFTFDDDGLCVLLTMYGLVVWIKERLLGPVYSDNILFRTWESICCIGVLTWSLAILSSSSGESGSENQPTNANQSRIRYGKYLCRKLINYL